jgi:hypothetical protein
MQETIEKSNPAKGVEKIEIHPQEVEMDIPSTCQATITVEGIVVKCHNDYMHEMEILKSGMAVYPNKLHNGTFKTKKDVVGMIQWRGK